MNRKLEAIENVETKDENGNIEVDLSETNDEFLQAFTIRAAYNVAQYLSCHSDVEDLQVPISLRKLVKPFVIKFASLRPCSASRNLCW